MTPPGIDFERWVRPELRGLKPYASARAISGDRISTIKLNANENPWPHDERQPLNRYPDPQPSVLVAALSEHWSVGPDNLLITRGSDEGIDLLMRLLVRPGVDRVMALPPCFGMYALYANIQGAELVEVALTEGERGWAVDWPAVEQADACRVYFLCSPNNPTGNTIDPVEVLAFAKKVEGHGMVVVDEAYGEFSDQPSLASMVNHQPNVVVLRTLSKGFGLAGARVGGVIAHPDLIAWLKRIIAPYPLPTPCVDAALAALTPDALAQQAEQIKRIQTNKQSLLNALDRLSFIVQCWPGQANFVLIKVANAASVMAHCWSSGIELRDQSHQPKLDQCIRITIGSESETDALIECLAAYNPPTTNTERPAHGV